LTRICIFIIENGAIEQRGQLLVFHYNFDQYLYEPKKGSGQGIGIFGRFGASDGDPTLCIISTALALAERVSSPTADQFGIGYYYMDISNPNSPAPVETRSFCGMNTVLRHIIVLP